VTEERYIQFLRPYFQELLALEAGEEKDKRREIFRQMWADRDDISQTSKKSSDCIVPSCEGANITFSKFCWKHSTEAIRTKRKDYVTQRRHTHGTAEYFDRKYENGRRYRDKMKHEIMNQLNKLRQELIKLGS